MGKRYVSVWFRHLMADWWTRRKPELKDVPFVLAAPERGRKKVRAVNRVASAKGIKTGMVVADCRAILPELQVFDDMPGKAGKLLHAIGEWCIRFSPVVAVDGEDGLILDASGCTHLWNGEEPYLKDIRKRLNQFGYDVRLGMADTIGAAWAIARYGTQTPIVEQGKQLQALQPLHPAALRLDISIIDRLEKLGLYQIHSFIRMPRTALRRRFGASLLTRLDQALGQAIEVIEPIQPMVPYQERLPSLEPIRTLAGIEIALRQLLEQLCERLTNESIGLRECSFKCYRIDGSIQHIAIGTNRPSRNVPHLLKLFELKISTIAPDLGIELFVLEATKVEALLPAQDALWHASSSRDDMIIGELLDTIAGKIGSHTIHRYLPDEHYWPEWAIKEASSLAETSKTTWRTDLPRPLHLLATPEPIEVTVPIPDYPPMLFIYKEQRHMIKKADGPERIEQEWWLQTGLFRDYYCVEDENGSRYWIFRSGSYDKGQPRWYLHGFFA